MKTTDFQVPDKDSDISIQLRIIEDENPEKREFNDACAIITHPHPLMGGSMNNNVVMGIADHLASRGIMSAMFNFRGVGKSTGSFDNCIGEQQDLINVSNFILNHRENVRKIILVGYSFGSVVALAAANQIKNLDLLSLISYPFKLISHIEPDYSPEVPLLLINGKRDRIAGFDRFLKEYENFQSEKTMAILDKADHYYSGFESELGAIIFDHIKTVI